MANWVRYPLPLSERFPFLESMQSGGAIPLRKSGISAILARCPTKTRQTGCDTPLCDTISKGYCAIWGGISHWAAKPATPREFGKSSLAQDLNRQMGAIPSAILSQKGIARYGGVSRTGPASALLQNYHITMIACGMTALAFETSFLASCDSELFSWQCCLEP